MTSTNKSLSLFNQHSSPSLFFPLTFIAVIIFVVAAFILCAFPADYPVCHSANPPEPHHLDDLKRNNHGQQGPVKFGGHGLPSYRVPQMRNEILRVPCRLYDEDEKYMTRNRPRDHE